MAHLRRLRADADGHRRRLYARDPMGVDLEQSLYALDSTTIDLCLNLFPWARFRRRKAAVKMHTLLDLRGNIPAFVHITEGKVHDVNVLDEIVPEAGILCDGSRLHRFPAAVCVQAQCGVLRGAHQGQRAVTTPLLASGGQEHRPAFGSDGVPGFLRVGFGLSRPAAENQLLRYQRECGEDANLDCGIGLRARGRPQAARAKLRLVPNPTDSQSHTLRKIPISCALQPNDPAADLVKNVNQLNLSEF